MYTKAVKGKMPFRIKVLAPECTGSCLAPVTQESALRGRGSKQQPVSEALPTLIMRLSPMCTFRAYTPLLCTECHAHRLCLVCHSPLPPPQRDAEVTSRSRVRIPGGAKMMIKGASLPSILTTRAYCLYTWTFALHRALLLSLFYRDGFTPGGTPCSGPALAAREGRACTNPHSRVWGCPISWQAPALFSSGPSSLPNSKRKNRK